MKTFKIYFHQVNQEVYTVKASSEEAAISKARKEWKTENSMPLLAGVEPQPE